MSERERFLVVCNSQHRRIFNSKYRFIYHLRTLGKTLVMKLYRHEKMDAARLIYLNLFQS